MCVLVMNILIAHVPISLCSCAVRMGLEPWVLIIGVWPANLSVEVVLLIPKASAALFIDMSLAMTFDIAFCMSLSLYALYGNLFLEFWK